MEFECQRVGRINIYLTRAKVKMGLVVRSTKERLVIKRYAKGKWQGTINGGNELGTWG